MARDFNGTTEYLDCGTDASITGFVSQSMSAWVRKDVVDASKCLLQKRNSADTDGWALFVLNNAGGNRVRFRSAWTTTGGTWRSAGQLTSATAYYHVAVVYSNSATSNDAALYIDGVLQTLETDTNPTGTYTGESGDSFLVGKLAFGTSFWDGLIGHVCYDDTLWTAAQVNRAKWWGTPTHNVEMYHPLWTSKLTNEGNATANATATGSAVVNLPRVERCHGSMMGCGR